MNKIQTIFHKSDIYQVISVNYAYWNLGTTLITFLLLLTAISIEPAVAADNVVSENQDPQLSASENLKASSIGSGLNSQPNVSLRQRLLASKNSSTVAEFDIVSMSDSLRAKVKPETFSNAFSVDNFGLESQEKLQSHENLEKQLLTDPISNTDLHLKEPTNLLREKPPQILVQRNFTSPVGDSFGETNKLRQELLIEPIVAPDKPRKSAPGSTAGTPSAYGASLGQAYIGGGLFFPLDQDKDRNDGSMSVGFGLGNPVDSVGLEVNIDITSVGGGPSFDFGDSGGVGFKLHRYLGDGSAVAVGWSNPIKWGDVTRAKDTIYGVFTKSFPLQPDNPNDLRLTVSLGVGTGEFSSKGALEADENSLNFFGGLGLRVIPQASLVSSWTGNILNIGGSFAPFKDTQIVINAIITDVTSNFDTGLGLSVTAGYGFRF
ncbi:hypothetical protein [Nodularia sphaerocarpa]|uniref:hypothetical protein n=1 Tax=Nodularia sphaerocarpa TaxID=137816 RepID=UPI001EFC0301|nr:hypothetical protein [Nodularia sphaerocarpa]MDB9371824.1 hypothetical protein [Nodularia sphaerocarpa CS-585]MDB9376477.1 hypothetical protein [Nodularia sphaerocarpa CS-585A2]ULP74188.1 hypothetical protein BDGGKGIB_03851 [Nodularia sphaerocarpa UHCC 0038]